MQRQPRPRRLGGAILRYNGVEKELSGGAAQTTNNRMELTGVISALSALKEELRCGAVLQIQNMSLMHWKRAGRAHGARAAG